MIRLGRTAVVTWLIAVGAFAQTAEDALQSKLTDVRYSSIADYARIQGDVHLVLSGGVVTVVSGPPLLAPMAVESAKAIGSIQRQADFDLTYHFVLVDTARSVPTSTTVKRGNAFERAILRLFGLKTEKVVQGYRCESGVPPANIVKLKGAAIEFWVFGGTHCLETNTAALVAER
jgi:hypothetical protein